MQAEAPNMFLDLIISWGMNNKNNRESTALKSLTNFKILVLHLFTFIMRSWFVYNRVGLNLWSLHRSIDKSRWGISVLNIIRLFPVNIWKIQLGARRQTTTGQPVEATMPYNAKYYLDNTGAVDLSLFSALLQCCSVACSAALELNWCQKQRLLIQAFQSLLTGQYLQTATSWLLSSEPLLTRPNSSGHFSVK